MDRSTEDAESTEGLDTRGNGSGDPETFAIIGSAIEVHRHLDPGFLDLKATGYRRGPLLNFGASRIESKRMVD